MKYKAMSNSDDMLQLQFVRCRSSNAYVVQWSNLYHYGRGKTDQLIVLVFNDMSTLVGHFVSSPRKTGEER